MPRPQQLAQRLRAAPASPTSLTGVGGNARVPAERFSNRLQSTPFAKATAKRPLFGTPSPETYRRIERETIQTFLDNGITTLAGFKKHQRDQFQAKVDFYRDAVWDPKTQAFHLPDKTDKPMPTSPSRPQPSSSQPLPTGEPKRSRAPQIRIIRRQPPPKPAKPVAPSPLPERVPRQKPVKPSSRPELVHDPELDAESVESLPPQVSYDAPTKPRDRPCPSIPQPRPSLPGYRQPSPAEQSSSSETSVTSENTERTPPTIVMEQRLARFRQVASDAGTATEEAAVASLIRMYDERDARHYARKAARRAARLSCQPAPEEPSMSAATSESTEGTSNTLLFESLLTRRGAPRQDADPALHVAFRKQHLQESFARQAARREERKTARLLQRPSIRRGADRLDEEERAAAAAADKTSSHQAIHRWLEETPLPRVEPASVPANDHDDERDLVEAILGQKFESYCGDAIAGLPQNDELHGADTESRGSSPQPPPPRSPRPGDSELLAKLQAEWIADQRSLSEDPADVADDRAPPPSSTSSRSQVPDNAQDSSASLDQEPLPKVTPVHTGYTELFANVIEDCRRQALARPADRPRSPSPPPISFLADFHLREDFGHEVLVPAVASKPVQVVRTMEPQDPARIDQQQYQCDGFFCKFSRKAISMAKTAWSKVKSVVWG